MNYKLILGLIMVLALVPFASAQENKGEFINGSFLWITDVDVDVCTAKGCDDDKDLSDGDKISEEADAGATIEFSIEVTNVWEELFPGDDQDIEIEDIEMTITIENIDDGDEIDEDADFDDLDPGDDDKVKIKFELPLEVEEDEYDVVIEIDGDSDNGTQRARMELTLEVEKEDNEIRIVRYSLTPSEVTCSRTVSLDMTVLNTGNDDQDDVVVDIVNNELGVSFSDEFDLETDFDDDASYRTNFRFTVEDSVAPGSYPIDARVTYDDGREVETTSENLIVGRCAALEEPEKEEKEDNMEQEEEEDDSVVVVRPGTDTQTPTTPVVVTPPQLPPTTEEDDSLFRSPNFLTLLIAGEVLLVIIAIVIIAAVMRRRD